MLWWYLGVPKEPGLILIVYISYAIYRVHGPNTCVVLWYPFYLSCIWTPYINLIPWRNQFIPGEGSAECLWYPVIKGTWREYKFHRTWWELSRAQIFAFLLKSATDKKEKKGGKKQWEKQRKKVIKDVSELEGHNGIRDRQLSAMPRGVCPPLLSGVYRHWTSYPWGHSSGLIWEQPRNRLNPVLTDW